MSESDPEWTVTARVLGNVVQFSSVATVPGNPDPVSRTVIARVKLPTPAEPKYTLLAGGDVLVTPGMTVIGDVTAKKHAAANAAYLKLGGRIEGQGVSYGAIWYPLPANSTIATATEGLTANYAVGNPVSDVLARNVEMRASLEATARALDTYFPRVGQAGIGKGYWIDLNGNTATVWAIGGELWDGISTTPIGGNFTADLGPNGRRILDTFTISPTL